MNYEEDNYRYIFLQHEDCSKPCFIDVNDNVALNAYREKHGNRDLFTLPCLFGKPDIRSARHYYLHFILRARSLKDIREPTIKACFYISEKYSIPQDCIKVIYTGGVNGTDTGTAAEFIILIPPVVFAGQPTPLISSINYKLARQLTEDGIENIDIDIYHRNHLIRLPNSLNPEKDCYVIPLTLKELMHIDVSALAELSRYPRPEDSLTMPYAIPEVSEWFAEILEETEKKQRYQQKLLNLLLKTGWQIPPCIRKLLWADLSKERALEACRVISQFYRWVNASPNEIYYHFEKIDQRNYIADPHRLRAILNFASENPGFAGCKDLLLRQFCPSGKCFLYELQNEINNPALFELKGG